ncbi:MAG: tetratricopeptide repeat protein [Candidatus Poribacteria bacterium]|nr:tetratricopeptide repeat protein [Candidatus Poribacteria bacterium]
MLSKGISFVACFLIVIVGAVCDAVAQTPQDLYARAMQAARQGEYPQALQYLHRAVDLNPDFAKAHAALGTVYLQLGDFPASEKALAHAMRMAPDLVQAKSNLALLYARTERFDDAIRVYQDLIQKHPESLQVWLGIASAYQQADRYKEAIEAYQESLKRSPNHTAAMSNLASCYEAVKQEGQAIRYYKAALAQDPNLSMANGNLGAIYQKQGELDKALPLLEKAVRHDPRFTAARYCLGLVLTKKRQFQRAAMEYQRVIAQQNDHVGAYYNLAQALFRLKRPEEGKQAMEIYCRLNAIAQEIEDRERAILIEPNNPLKQYQLGLVYAKYGKFPKAISAFQTALALDAKAHYALNALARLYILQGIESQDAIAHAEKAFHLTQSPQYMHTLALAYFQAGKRENALKAIQTAIEMDPENDAFRQTLTKMKEADEKTK